MSVFAFPDAVIPHLGGDPADAQERRTQAALDEFEPLRGKLQPHRTILDIGCGLAMKTVLLARETGATEVCLLDGDGDQSNRRYGFNEGTEAWFDVQIAEAMCRANLPGVEVRSYAAEPATVPCDLLVSFKSWGHHYPIARYLALADRSLHPEGEAVIDLRKGQNGARELASIGLRPIAQLSETPKFERLLFKREPRP